MSVNRFFAVLALLLIVFGIMGIVSVCFAHFGIIMVIAGIIILIITGVIGVVKGTWSLATKKRCPHCRNKISRKADVCPYCGYSLRESKQTASYSNSEQTSKTKVSPQSKNVVNNEQRFERGNISNFESKSRCPHCGAEIESDSRYCKECGKEVI